MKKRFEIILVAICSLFATQSFCQDVIPIDSIMVLYNKITLDGGIAYIHRDTDEIISEDDFQALITLADFDILTEANDSLDLVIDNISIENWDTLRVNPYKKRKLDPPFPIFFKDLDYVSPVDDKIVVTSRFGRRRRGPHRGIDIDLVTGDNVRSILPGKVRFVGYSRGHGRTVVVRHENDLETVYAHLSEYNVEVNDYVDKGEIIGKGGTTGNARGSHLHLETRYKGVCVHPEYLFDFEKEKKVRSNEFWVTSGWTNPRIHSSYRKSKVKVLESRDLAIASQKKERKVHVVRKGDTLHGIARRNGMYVKEILALNGISYNSILKIGQHLVLVK